ncbi:extracellular solute-binding protein [Roseiflexus sp. RS-1]|uniref:extracellular solute-binding protein n=1 Tax=Roseiflexus sp. (strain RS-1) TaxID=357808 RepID=UPI0000D81FCC|nr:extracellular solute-binding protein [Roseiflexus sp. RS-1]ABQ90673.1 extracellular solute-binding protein, family 1 [Roseiflexus sp. RS-1]
MDRLPGPLVARLMTLIISVTLIAACGGQPAATPPTAAPAEPTAAPTTAPTEPTAAPTAPTAAPTEPAAMPKGEVVVYTTRAEALFKPVIEAFNAAYPDIKVTVLNGSNSELAARILEERANPKADVLINSDILTMENLAAEGVFAPNNSPAVMAVPADYRADDGSWVALTLRARVIMYNTDLVSPEELPKKMVDLADPKWKDVIGSANSTNGAMMAQLVIMRNQLGEPATEAFIQGLLENNAQFFGGHTDVRKAVGAGELKLGLVNHYYYHLSKAEGAPVGVIYPDQEDGGLGLMVNSTNAGIIKGGPNPEMARIFVDFMLSPAGQKIYAERNYEYPIVPGVPLAEGVAPLDSFRLNPFPLKTLRDELEPTRALVQKVGMP